MITTTVDGKGDTNAICFISPVFSPFLLYFVFKTRVLDLQSRFKYNAKTNNELKYLHTLTVNSEYLVYSF